MKDVLPVNLYINNLILALEMSIKVQSKFTQNSETTLILQPA